MAGSTYTKATNWLSQDGPVMTTSADNRATRTSSGGGTALLVILPTAATMLVWIPALLRNPSTTEAAPPWWLAALLLAAPLSAYLASRHRGAALGIGPSLFVGLPQVPVIMLLSAAAVWLDVQRGHLLAGSGEEAMSYGIGMGAAFVAGIILLTLVAVAAGLGGGAGAGREKLVASR